MVKTFHDSNFINGLLESKMIFLFLNLETYIAPINEFIKNETINLRIGKTEFDDVLNLLFIDERLKEKVVLISSHAQSQSINQIPLVDDENRLLKRILAENGSVLDSEAIFSSLKRSILSILISIKLFFLKRSLKKRFNE